MPLAKIKSFGLSVLDVYGDGVVDHLDAVAAAKVASAATVGVIGIGVDAATGASQELVPNPVTVALECRRQRRALYPE